MTAADIILTARSMLGTPFVHQGRVPGKALDCAGLVVSVAAALNIEHVDVTGYGRRPHQGLLEATVDGQECLFSVLLNDLQPGDILLMRFAKEPQHLAIYAGETIIHSYEAAGQVCEHGMDDVWRKRIIRAYRFVGVES